LKNLFLEREEALVICLQYGMKSLDWQMYANSDTFEHFDNVQHFYFIGYKNTQYNSCISYMNTTGETDYSYDV
jgi:hypothetical protein